jgi:uncharacterized protein (TIGR03790 family)
MTFRVLGRRSFAAIALLAIAVGAAPAALAQSAENVAVVANDNSPESQHIAEYYARTRGLPASNVLRIQTTAEETIERDAYVKTIEQPLGVAIRRAGLQDRLLYLVLTKGVPLRIAGTTGVNGTLASVDSELTLLYRRLLGLPATLTGAIDNPYYLGSREIADARPFSHREHDIYLVTRIDAFTVDEAIGLVDRAQAPSKDGRIVLDQIGTGGTGDQWLERAAKRLESAGHLARIVLESTPELARTGEAVLGYYASGPPDLTNRARRIGLRFVSGGVAASLASFDARTFRRPPNEWRPTSLPDKSKWFEGSGDPLIGDLVGEGVTGVSGQVGEAYVLGAVRPEILFSAYLSGFNLAEAFYLATPVLSWQTIVIGDPLCAPFRQHVLTQDGVADGVDAITGLPGLFSKRRIAVVRQANPDEPEPVAALLVRGDRALERGDRTAARRALEEALVLAPRAVSLMVSLAQLEEQDGDDGSAIPRYRHILELQPANVVALNNLAFALAVRHGGVAEALPLARQAASLAPQSGTVLDTVGWVEHLAGNNARAVEVLARAVQLEPGQAEIWLHAAIAYLAAGDSGAAEMHLEEALRVDPEFSQREDVKRFQKQLAGLVAATPR